MKALLVCKDGNEYICAGLATVSKKNIGKIKVFRTDGYGGTRAYGKVYSVPIENKYVADIVANRDLPQLKKNGNEYNIASNPVHFWIFNWEAYNEAKEK